MFEKVAELDEELTMKYLEGEEITIAELKAAFVKVHVKLKSFLFFAVLLIRIKVFNCCWMLLLTYMPAPIDVPDIKGLLEDGTEDNS